MMFKGRLSCFFSILLLTLHVATFVEGLKAPSRGVVPNGNSKDPFSALGIPDLNPKALLQEIENEGGKKGDREDKVVQLKSIEDLPKFLANSKLNEEEGIKILTRFLIQVIIFLLTKRMI